MCPLLFMVYWVVRAWLDVLDLKLNAALVQPMVTLVETAKLDINILNVAPHVHVKVI